MNNTQEESNNEIIYYTNDQMVIAAKLMERLFDIRGAYRQDVDIIVRVRADSVTVRATEIIAEEDDEDPEYLSRFKILQNIEASNSKMQAEKNAIKNYVG